jgi:hypothetical protein
MTELLVGALSDGLHEDRQRIRLPVVPEKCGAASALTECRTATSAGRLVRMQSQATTVKQYLDQLPADRRASIEAVREVILESLDKDYEEGMQYGMIGYYVPHRVHPAGYHCDPKQPLPFAALGSQKNHMALHLMCTYLDTAHATWFRQAWAKTGKKLDMGKACVRFKKLDDLALDVIGEAIRRVPAKKYVANIQAVLERGAKAKKSSAGVAKKSSAGATKKTPSRAKAKAARR